MLTRMFTARIVNLSELNATVPALRDIEIDCWSFGDAEFTLVSSSNFIREVSDDLTDAEVETLTNTLSDEGVMYINLEA